jgi:hypothetical protein
MTNKEELSAQLMLKTANHELLQALKLNDTQQPATAKSSTRLMLSTNLLATNYN